VTALRARVEAGANSGALGNAIKTEAKNQGVLTDAMNSADPIMVVSADAMTTKKVDTLVFASASKKKDLSDGEIAAIVICSMIFAAGVIYAIMMNAGGEGESVKGDSVEDALDGVGGHDDYGANDV